MPSRVLLKYAPVLATAAAVVAIHLALSAADAEFYMSQVIMSAYYALAVIGLCLLMGYAGQASLGHAGFFAIGGYTSAVLTTWNLAPYRDAGWLSALAKAGLVLEQRDLYDAVIISFSPWLAFVAALVIAGAVALLIGVPVLRLKGHYLAMATLGFGLIIHRIALGTPVLGQNDGIYSVPAWRLAGALEINSTAAFRIQNYYIAWAAVLVAMVLAIHLVHSRVGLALRSIHDSEEGAHSLGVDTYRYKLYVFVLSAVFAAAGGSLITHYRGSIGPAEASVMNSVRYVAIVAVGGMANLWGGMVMSVLLNFLSLRGVFGTYDDAIFGAILIVIIIFLPAGLLRMPRFVGPLLLRVRQRRHAAPDRALAQHGVFLPTLRYAAVATPSDPETLLETRGLCRSFGGLQAVKDVSFAVPRGVIKAVIGPNGAGKTTLFNLVAGSLPPNAGEVFFRGGNITGYRPHAIAALGIARTFQTTRLFGHMTILENVMVGRHPRTRSGFVPSMLRLPRATRELRESRRRAMEILEDLGLAAHAGEIAANLSFGRQRLVEFARALATEPVLLLLDEPAAGLNIYETQALSNLILKVRQSGITCLVVEHDMSLVMSICDEIVVLDQGQKLAEGAPREIQRNPDVIRIYLGEEPCSVS